MKFKLTNLIGASLALFGLVSLGLLLTGYVKIGLIIWSVGYLTLIFRQLNVFRNNRWRNYPTLQLPTRIYYTLGIAGILLSNTVSHQIFAWIALFAVLFFSNINAKIENDSNSINLRMRNIPGLEDRKYPRGILGFTAVYILLLPPLFLILTLLEVSGLILFITSIVAVIAIITKIFLLRAWKNFRISLAKDLPNKISDYAPTFVLYWRAPKDTKYQLDMWIDFLNRIEEKYIIIVRTRASILEANSAAPNVPIVWARTLSDVDSLIVDSMQAVFYVNNAAHNMHMVRHSRLKHIQLLHGDSEKTTSFNPVTAMYDKIYVAGQAAIDRYTENGINIPAEKFEIVGRPQVEAINLDNRHISTINNKTVLYAPTWYGHFQDTQYSSLEYIKSTIEALLDLGVRIIFRPHPYAYSSPILKNHIKKIHKLLSKNKRDSNTGHLWGKVSEKNMSINDCFNAADAMISDVSSVVTDFLFSGKPLAISTGKASTPESLKDWKLTQGAYIITPNLETNKNVLAQMLKEDPLEEIRHEMRKYYLGDFPAENYASVFIEQARKDINSPKN